MLLIFGLASLPSHVDLTRDGQAVEMIAKAVDSGGFVGQSTQQPSASNQQSSEALWLDAAMNRLKELFDSLFPKAIKTERHHQFALARVNVIFAASLTMARQLHEKLRIPANGLLSQTSRRLPNDDDLD